MNVPKEMREAYEEILFTKGKIYEEYWKQGIKQWQI